MIGRPGPFLEYPSAAGGTAYERQDACWRDGGRHLLLSRGRRGARDSHRDPQGRARRPPGDRRQAGQPYERLSGKFYGELDPADPKNALITDIQLAPRNARGKVEYVGTFSLMKPVDMSKASGVLMYSVVNRGNGAAAASAEGHISLVSGWQGDVVPTATNQTIQVPSREES